MESHVARTLLQRRPRNSGGIISWAAGASRIVTETRGWPARERIFDMGYRRLGTREDRRNQLGIRMDISGAIPPNISTKRQRGADESRLVTQSDFSLRALFWFGGWKKILLLGTDDRNVLGRTTKGYAKRGAALALNHETSRRVAIRGLRIGDFYL